MRNYINNWLITPNQPIPRDTFSLVRRSTTGTQTPIYEVAYLATCHDFIAQYGTLEDTVTIVKPDGTLHNFPWAIQENELHEISLVVPTTTDIATMRQALIILGANNPLRHDWDQYMLDVARWGLLGGPQPNPETYGFTADEIRTDTWFLTTPETENNDAG